MVSHRLSDAVRGWEGTPRPVANFLAGRVTAITFGIELDLDHQASYLETMIKALLEQNQYWDYGLRAGDELKDLAEFQSRLEALELPDEIAAPFCRYIDATRAMLDMVVEEARHRKRIQGA